MGEFKKKFYEELRSYIGFGMKEGFIDEETADRVLFKYDFDEQYNWLADMELRAEIQADAFQEHMREVEGEKNETKQL